MTHSHSHDHGAAHSNRTRLAVAFGITVAVLVAQAVGAVLTGSLALLVDTAHMLTDAGGLLMALIAAQLMLRPASAKHTWGMRRAEVLAAALQSLLLLAVGTYAVIIAAQRLFDPPEVPAGSLLVFGIIGLAGNIASLVVLLAAELQPQPPRGVPGGAQRCARLCRGHRERDHPGDDGVGAGRHTRGLSSPHSSSRARS